MRMIAINSTCIRIRSANDESLVIPQLSNLSDIDAVLSFKTENEKHTPKINDFILITIWHSAQIHYLYPNLPFPWLLFFKLVILACITFPLKVDGGLSSSSVMSFKSGSFTKSMKGSFVGFLRLRLDRHEQVQINEHM